MRRKLPYLIQIVRGREKTLSKCRTQSYTVLEFNGTDKRGEEFVPLQSRKTKCNNSPLLSRGH